MTRSADLRARLGAVNPVFAQPVPAAARLRRHRPGPAAGGGSSAQAAFAYPVAGLLPDQRIARASATMAECSRTYATPALQAAE